MIKEKMHTAKSPVRSDRVMRKRLSEQEQVIRELPLLAEKLDKIIQLQEKAIELEERKLKRKGTMSIQEAAKHLGVCQNTLRALKDAGILRQGVHFLKHRSNYFFRPDFAEKMFTEEPKSPGISPPMPPEGKGGRRSTRKRPDSSSEATIDPNY